MWSHDGTPIMANFSHEDNKPCLHGNWIKKPPLELDNFCLYVWLFDMVAKHGTSVNSCNAWEWAVATMPNSLDCCCMSLRVLHWMNDRNLQLQRLIVCYIELTHQLIDWLIYTVVSMDDRWSCFCHCGLVGEYHSHPQHKNNNRLPNRNKNC